MANRIKELRKKRKITLKQLSNQTGISVSSLSAYENDKRSPKIKNWVILADFFNVPVPYLQGAAFSKDQIGIDDNFPQFAADFGLLNGDLDLDKIPVDEQDKIAQTIFNFKAGISFLISSDFHSRSKEYSEYLDSVLNMVTFLSISILGDEEMRPATRKKIMRRYIQLINDFYKQVYKSDIGHLVLTKDDSD